MKAYCIALKDNKVSQRSYKELVKSSKSVKNDFDIQMFEAVTPEKVEKIMREFDVAWNYPWKGSQIDFSSGLRKSAYETKDPLKRIACALSHYMLWKKCSRNGPILVLEHDAYFIKKLDTEYLLNSSYGIIGINDPRGATRLSFKFHDMLQNSKDDITGIPHIDDVKVPQGLAGNSAYIMKPSHAEHMLKMVKEFGMWPNDALMCRQLVPNLGVSKTYYTRVQGTTSTTSL